MGDKNTGGPAFPVLHSIDGNWIKEPVEKFVGMTLRDYFAGQVLQGLVAAMYARETWSGWCDDSFTFESYRLADAMLKAREA